MSSASIQAGDRVRVNNIPGWLLRDLPEEDQLRLETQKGKIVTVLKLMPHGFLWVSFADGTEGFSLQPSDVQFESKSDASSPTNGSTTHALCARLAKSYALCLRVSHSVRQQMREFSYAMIGLLIAALPPAIFLTVSIVLGDPYALDNLVDPLILFAGLVASSFFYILLLGGIPFVILRSFNLVRWWSAVAIGTLAGLGFVFLFGVAHLDISGIIGFPCSGATSGFLFWLVWRKGREFRSVVVA